MSVQNPEPAIKRKGNVLARTIARNGRRTLEDLVRDKDFLLDDGGIVLVTGKTVFKMYRYLLGAQSPVFSDMVAAAAPSSDQMMEGCPMVHLSDSPEDLRHFLRALLPKTQRRPSPSCSCRRSCVSPIDTRLR
ncbi:hypothetical protein OH76DRAFT_781442 [Lentinus brumalis]|uniref:BTB domain-containing protein n=1 Tax=Lentinus brumalis TaxID=2498619 RepID=A0A371D3S6_9APHY|nr:hypothetical protein OH76DRAFT_781442 [Polyporus brumalis]